MNPWEMAVQDGTEQELLRRPMPFIPPPPSVAVESLPVVDQITTKADIDLCLGSGELLPCPFCGHWAMSAGEKKPNGKGVCWKISCTRSRRLVPDCCASVWATDTDPAKARRDAVARWNRRPVVATPPAKATP